MPNARAHDRPARRGAARTISYVVKVSTTCSWPPARWRRRREVRATSRDASDERRDEEARTCSSTFTTLLTPAGALAYAQEVAMAVAADRIPVDAISRRCAAAVDHALVPAQAPLHSDTETPVSAFLSLRRDRAWPSPRFLTSSPRAGPAVGRWSFIVAPPGGPCAVRSGNRRQGSDRSRCGRHATARPARSKQLPNSRRQQDGFFADDIGAP